jgi:hypothetical protein
VSDLVKIVNYAPGSAGPTGPALMAVLAVPTGGTHLNLNAPEFSALKNCVDRSIPMMIAVEQTNVAYRFDIQGSGPSADPSMTVYGPTAANMAGTIFANTRLAVPEIAPAAEGLSVRAYGAVGTCMMRIWRAG